MRNINLTNHSTCVHLFLLDITQAQPTCFDSVGLASRM